MYLPTMVNILDSRAMGNTSYRTVIASTTYGIGRPWFNEGKDQLEYLSS